MPQRQVGASYISLPPEAHLACLAPPRSPTSAHLPVPLSLFTQAYLHTTGAQYFKRGLLDVMQRRSEERPPRIGVDVQQEQRAVDQQLSELDRALRGAEGAQAAARQAVTEARAAWEAARRRAQGAAREKEEAEWELTQAERKSQHATQRAAPLSLDTFDERVRDAEEALRRAEEAQGPAAEQAEAAAAALREREAAADEFKPQKRELKERLAELYRQQEVLTGERQNAADERRVKQEKLDRALAGRKAVEQQLADASAQFEQHLAMAEKCCSRVRAGAFPAQPSAHASRASARGACVVAAPDGPPLTPCDAPPVSRQEDLQKVPVKAKDAEEEAAMAPEKVVEARGASLPPAALSPSASAQACPKLPSLTLPWPLRHPSLPFRAEAGEEAGGPGQGGGEGGAPPRAPAGGDRGGAPAGKEAAQDVPPQRGGVRRAARPPDHRGQEELPPHHRVPQRDPPDHLQPLQLPPRRPQPQRSPPRAV